ncbi:MAG: hypothetical protein K6C14_02700 [Eubacterium sp.]|nr:hypothetical protein [Eubacterium sp.]
MKVVISARNFFFDGCNAAELLRANGFEVLDITDKNISSETDYFNEIRDADAVINAFEPMSRQLLEKCGRLKLVSVRGVGYDYIDSAACRDLNIALARTVGAVGNAVSEQVMAYILYFARQIHALNGDMQQGRWNRIMTEGTDKKRLGIIGFGEIGQALAKKAEAFGMSVMYYCKTPKPALSYAFTPLDELLKQSDYVVLALPLTEETRGLIDENALKEMKSTAVLINVARSGTVDAEALKNAVESGIIKGAAVDVFEKEPCTDSVLRGVDNILLTPHTAPFTKNNFIEMNNLAAENIINYFNSTIDKKYLV